MKEFINARRSFLTRLILSLPAFSFLTACSSAKNKSQQAVEQLIKLLRHHGVAAHLGRLNVETNTSLKSLTKEELTTDLLSDLDITIEQFNDMDGSEIREIIDNKIRQDFSDENVIAVDGWLLSQTEAKICALVFHNIKSQQA